MTRRLARSSGGVEASTTELQVATAASGPASHDGLAALDGNPLLEARVRLGADADNVVRDSLVRRYAFGIPTDEALEAIASGSPGGVVELGAGTGYWARLLFERGVDVVAHDRWPPPDEENPFFAGSAPWYPVQPGDEGMVECYPHRTLLVVWPTKNETWPATAVSRFHAAGGKRLVVVGEDPGGRTGDPAFHAVLGDWGPCLSCRLSVVDAPCVCAVRVLWRVTRRVPLPSWAGGQDACLFYEPARTGTISWRRPRLRSRTAKR